MTALLHPQISPFFIFEIEHPGQPARLALSNSRFGLVIGIRQKSLTLEISATPDTPPEHVKLGLAPIDPGEKLRLTFETGDAGARYIVLERGDSILLSMQCPFDLEEEPTLESHNIELRETHWNRHAVTGLVSAPARSNALVLVNAPGPLASDICGVLEEHMPHGTHIRILIDEDSEMDDPFGRTIRPSDLQNGTVGSLSDVIANIILVSITGLDHLEPEEIGPVIDWCPNYAIRLCFGGFIQKIPAERFAGISDGTVPLLLSSGRTLPPLSFAPNTWFANISQELQYSFEYHTPTNLVKVGATAKDAGPQYRFSSPLWHLGRFWSVTDWDEPADGRFGFAWVFATLFGRNGKDMHGAVDRLRTAYRSCKSGGIRLFGASLSGAEKPLYVLTDTDLLALAADASFARGQRPLTEYFKALEEKTSFRTFETDSLKIVLLHADTQSEDAMLEEMLHNIADALADTHKAKQPSGRMLAYLDSCRDAIQIKLAVNAIGGDHGFDLAPETLLRFATQHPQLVVPLISHVLQHAAPSKLPAFMQVVAQMQLRPQQSDLYSLLSSFIGTRMFPDSDKRFWNGLKDQPYDSRRWAALQTLEQLSSTEYEVRGPAINKSLQLLSQDAIFGQTLALLKQGNLELAAARGREAVLHHELRPENENDMLAISLLADDFETVDLLEESLTEPLTKLDATYLKGMRAAREGTFTPEERTLCTSALLNLDEDFADLKVKGRSYRTLSDFASPPDPDKDVICVITAKNEESRLRETLAYHHGIGLRHFILIDNMSSDGTLDLAREYGAKIIQTGESYKDSRYGMAWVNDVLDRHCTGFWSLVVDADEMFVYPRAESRPVADFAKELEKHGYEAFGCILLDMYPEAPISTFKEVPRGKLQELYRYFDAGNFAYWPRLRSPLMGISGGVRDRIFRIGRFAHLAPIAQTKTPLVKWAAGMKYLTSTHDITPVRAPFFFGALEHYKYTPDFVQRAKREVIRKEHWGGGSEYAAYASVLEADPEMSFMNGRFTHERQSSTQLIQTVCPFPWPEDLL